jgi:3-polyprenyl-4-hydroxybenzoate decarboxylase
MRIIVAMTGATGAVCGVRLLAASRRPEAKTHLAVSRWAEVRPSKGQGFSHAYAIIALLLPAFNGNSKSTDDLSDQASAGDASKALKCWMACAS